MTCQLCQADNGNYSMNQQCCRVRFLLHEPRVDVRRAWIERWKKKFGEDDSKAIKAAFSEEYEKRKNVLAISK